MAEIQTPAQRLGAAAYLAARKLTASATRRCNKRMGRAHKVLENTPSAPARAAATEWLQAYCRACGGCERAGE